MAFQGTSVGIGHWNKVMSWEKIYLRGRSVCSTGDGNRKEGESMAGDGLLQSKRRIGFGR